MSKQPLTAQELQLKIDTEYDGKGADAAAKDIEKIGKASKKAGEEQDKAGKHAQQFGQSTGRAAEMVGSLTGAMGQSGPAAARMGAGLRVIKALAEGSAGGLAGLATVLVGMGVSAWVTYQRKVEEGRKKLAEFAAQIEANKRAQDAAGVEKLAGQYDVLRAAIDDSTAAQNRLNQAQAAADNAEKAARMADITLREKQAMSGIKEGDTVGAARVSAQFASERRDLEAEYALRDAERTAHAKAQALSDAEAKLRITEQMDVLRAKEEKQKFEDQMRRVNEDLADLYGPGAPMKTLMMPLSAVNLGAKAPEPIKVVDKEEQEKRAAALRNQLVEVDKDGKPTGRGLEPAYRAAAEALAAAIDRMAKEKVEVQARRIEAEAAVQVYDTTRDMTPRINAADAALEQRDILKQQWGQRLVDLRRRASSASSSLSARSASLSAAAEAFDPQRADYPHQGAWNQAKIRDRRMDDQAERAARLSASAAKLDDQLSKMKPEQLAGVFDSITAQLARLETAVKNAEQRSKRQ